jgi:lipid II:glycine glycyltransferase (peptidoglycan interpeptide bridge formation enzyme)
MSWQRYEGDAAAWDQEVERLGGSFYQSYGWGEVRRLNGWLPLRLIAIKDESYVAFVCVLVKRKLGVAVCWVPGGLAGPVDYLDDRFQKFLLRELKTPFVYCRVGFLRKNEDMTSIYLNGLNWVDPKVKLNSGLTMLYDCKGSQSSRLERLSGNWRHNLKRSNRYGLRVDHWTSPDPCEMSTLYREMEEFKSLPTQHSEAELIGLMQTLGRNIVVYRCRTDEGKLVAFRAAGVYGGKAIDLLAASGQRGRKVYASYATLWALFAHCQNMGVETYDMSGVDPGGNKGVFNFKKGTGASMVRYLGEKEWSSVHGLSFLVNSLVSRKFS